MKYMFITAIFLALPAYAMKNNDNPNDFSSKIRTIQDLYSTLIETEDNDLLREQMQAIQNNLTEIRALLADMDDFALNALRSDIIGASIADIIQMNKQAKEKLQESLQMIGTAPLSQDKRDALAYQFDYAIELVSQLDASIDIHRQKKKKENQTFWFFHPGDVDNQDIQDEDDDQEFEAAIRKDLNTIIDLFENGQANTLQ